MENGKNPKMKTMILLQFVAVLIAAGIIAYGIADVMVRAAEIRVVQAEHNMLYNAIVYWQLNHESKEFPESIDDLEEYIKGGTPSLYAGAHEIADGYRLKSSVHGEQFVSQFSLDTMEQHLKIRDNQ